MLDALSKKLMIPKERILGNRWLRFLGKAIHDQDLWHLNRKSASRAVPIGIFWMLIPMPFQMVPSAICAVKLRANLPLSLGLVWITNPVTMPFIFFAQYLFGAWMLGGKAETSDPAIINGHFATFDNWLDWQWLTSTLVRIGGPLYLGAIVSAVRWLLALRQRRRIHKDVGPKDGAAHDACG